MSFFMGTASNAEDTKLKNAVANGAFLVDVRTHEEFMAGSVSDAVNIPLNTVPEEIERFRGKGEIVVFCQSGARSGEAKRILEFNGIDNVMNGGPWVHVNYIKNNI